MIKSLSAKDWKKFHDKDIDQILADAEAWRLEGEWIAWQPDTKLVNEVNTIAIPELKRLRKTWQKQINRGQR